MFIYCLRGLKIYLLFLFALKLQLVAYRLGLFVVHHVHRVYLISVSLFCLFNVAFSGLVCVSASDVRVEGGGKWGKGRIFLSAHWQLTWYFSTSSNEAEILEGKQVNCWTFSTHLHANIDNENSISFYTSQCCWFISSPVKHHQRIFEINRAALEWDYCASVNISRSCKLMVHGILAPERHWHRTPTRITSKSINYSSSIAKINYFKLDNVFISLVPRITSRRAFRDTNELTAAH